MPRLDALLPTQWWYRDAAALVFFTAVFERTRWRYNGPRAYRAVLLEAGHVCQTFCLTATWLGLAPFCSMALADAAIEKALGLDGVSESVLYAAGVGRRPALSADVPPGALPSRTTRRQNPLTMADPLVHVEQIAFRFPGAPRAVPLAHQNGVAIGPPEWKRGVLPEPAAYVRPPGRRSITIKAVFSCSDPAVRSVRVRARRTGASGFFRDVAAVTVRFTGGRSKAIACRVSCSAFKGVALERVKWQWQYRIAGRWISANRTDHEIALVLARPEPPWKGTRPWWEVMRLACQAARRSTTLAAAASKVTTTVFRDWGRQPTSAGTLASTMPPTSG